MGSPPKRSRALAVGPPPQSLNQLMQESHYLHKEFDKSPIVACPLQSTGTPLKWGTVVEPKKHQMYS